MGPLGGDGGHLEVLHLAYQENRIAKCNCSFSTLMNKL